MMAHHFANVAALAGKVCPKAPAGAQVFADQLTGYVLWGVLVLFVIGGVTGVGSIVAGRGPVNYELMESMVVDDGFNRHVDEVETRLLRGPPLWNRRRA